MLNYFQHMDNIAQRKIKPRPSSHDKICWLDYTIEALKAIDKDATMRIFDISKNLQQNLQHKLADKNMLLEFKHIGGMAENTHINHNETVDLLIILKGYQYPQSSKDEIFDPELEDLILLRDYTKLYLKNKFPEALFDDSQSLALEMSSSSIPCKFCYYFALWHHPNKEMAFGNFLTKTQIKLLNSKPFELDNSDPLTNINELNAVNEKTRGNTKNLIRILKNLKADAFEPVTLSGYQITSIICSMDEHTLFKPPGQILFLLLETSLYLKKLQDNSFLRNSLKSPDGNLLIPSTGEKSFIHGVTLLKRELDSLIKQLVLEIELYADIALKPEPLASVSNYIQ